MGQYYLIVNLDKKQFLHPHKCGDGLILLEFACGASGTLTALACSGLSFGSCSMTSG